MADVIQTIRTLKLTREQIAAMVGKNPRAIQLIEALALDVSITLPAAIEEAQLSSLFSLHGADGSKQAAQNALHISAEGQILLQACQRATATAAALYDEVNLLRTELHDTRARLLSAVQQAQRTASDALTLVSGA